MSAKRDVGAVKWANPDEEKEFMDWRDDITRLVEREVAGKKEQEMCVDGVSFRFPATDSFDDTGIRRRGLPPRTDMSVGVNTNPMTNRTTVSLNFQRQQAAHMRAQTGKGRCRRVRGCVSSAVRTCARIMFAGSVASSAYVAYCLVLRWV